MKISIVMITYNGEMYIKEQLDSLRMQSRKADEVIIVDDNSSDNTNVIIDEYIKKYELKTWFHKINKQNIGWKKNFMEAIRLATGDVICTCDQDDIWYSYKLKVVEKIMYERKDVLLFASNYDLDYDEKKIECFNFEKIQKYKFSSKFMCIMRPGCVYCFRKELFDKAMSLWFEDCPHDALLWRLANINDGLYISSSSLIYYRRHENTATGHEKKDVKERLKSLEYYLQSITVFYDYLNKNENIQKKDYKKKILLKCKKWCLLRKSIYEKKSLKSWFILSMYMRFYYNIKSYFMDLFILLKDI